MVVKLNHISVKCHCQVMKCEGNTLLIKYYVNTTKNALNHINFHNFPLLILSKQTFFNLQSECFDKKSKYKAVSAQHIRPPSHVWRSLDPTKTFDHIGFDQIL